MAWKFVSETHEPLRQLLIPHRGKEITNDQWRELVKQIPGIGSKAQYIQPSDHCTNMNNEGACECAETDRALLTRVRRGRPSIYLVL